VIALRRWPSRVAFPAFAVLRLSCFWGLVSYGVTEPDLFDQATSYVKRILDGASPGELPVQQPTKVELVINLKTAKALDLIIPPALISRADQLIE
jgi:ABC-type uncharacterized transport system substrate-binding protein